MDLYLLYKFLSLGGIKMDYAKLAISNISNYGDTDIFPYPTENSLFYDRPELVEPVILDMETHFDDWMVDCPIDYIKTCVPVGYTGYRWATSIDPLWNCFLLYQTLKVSEKIELNRIPVSKKRVFSYRINVDENTSKIFDSEQNWRAFCLKSLEIAESGKYHFVVRFDISDFYNRVYHHRLENALEQCGIDVNVKKRIMKILQVLSSNASYGLPVGGNASRILAEILLNSFDKMMEAKRYDFCRYVDDYILFAETREDAFRKLNYCADFLLRNEGLGLQKSKTQVLTVSEFISQVKSVVDAAEDENDDESKMRAEFMKLHIHYDPYSATADEDYDTLKQNIEHFDIVSLLKNEVRKSRIHHALGKQIMNAIMLLDGPKLDLVFNLIGANIENLYPIFPSVMRVAHKKILGLSDRSRKEFISILYKLVESDSYILQTENNAAYVVRVFARVNDEMSIQAIEALYSRASSTPLVKSDCIHAMINLDNSYWLSDIKSRFPMLSSRERRAFVAASYFLNDEGKHWREHTKGQFTELEKLIAKWVSTKNPVQSGWKIPI